MAVPVLAIGPENAEKNPNIVFMGPNVEIYAPSGVFNEWINLPDMSRRIMVKDAAKFTIQNAISPPMAVIVMATQNKWHHLTMELSEDVLRGAGLDATYAHEHATNYPAGIYIKWFVLQE